MVHNLRLLLAAVLLATCGLTVQAQQISHLNDHVLNARGQGRVTVATGVPYVGITEYAHGLSDRVTVGVLGGFTPRVPGYGIRARAVLYQPHDGFRVYFCTPVILYPKSGGRDPWWLVRPNINLEWITTPGLRYKFGGSVIATTSHYALFGSASRATFAPGFWQAIHGGVSFPIRPGVTFQVESSLVLDGPRVAGSDWVGGPPVIVVIGTAWTL